jgi:type II secretory ATPase GspE/PulE/Tfp pilus assembly ATPase PilB-like protein
MSTLYDDGIRKVLEGTTTIDEVFRVAKKSG